MYPISTSLYLVCHTLLMSCVTFAASFLDIFKLFMLIFHYLTAITSCTWHDKPLQIRSTTSRATYSSLPIFAIVLLERPATSHRSVFFIFLDFNVSHKGSYVKYISICYHEMSVMSNILSICTIFTKNCE